MDDRGEYSTLEVAPNQPHHGGPEYAQGIETVPTSNYPEVVQQQGEQHTYPSDRKADYPAGAAYGKPEQAALEPVPQAPPAEKRRICGLTRKLFFIIAAIIAVVVVAAVVGGAVGATSGKTSSHSSSTAATPSPTSTSTSTGPPTSTPTAAVASDILATSALNSANWTDAGGHTHHAVFYQTKANLIMMSLWDSQNTTWSVKNVSVSGAVAPSAAPGTPLTSATTSVPYVFQLNLYYLTKSNQIIEVYTTDPQGGTWSAGNLIAQNVVTGPKSDLAAYWQHCKDAQCFDDIIVLFQDDNSQFNVANSSNWADTYSIDLNMTTGTSLALVPLSPPTDNNNVPYQMRAYFDSASDQSHELQWLGPTLGGDEWYDGGLPSIPLTNTAPDITAASFGTHDLGPYEIILIFLFSNGTISANWWDNTVWHARFSPTPALQQSNFSAIAVNNDMYFYGLSAGTIYEYTIDGSTPTNWAYVNPVNTTWVASK